MGRYLVILFIVVPLLEIAVFIQAGELIGLWPTLGGIVLTAVIGVALLRHQGISAVNRARTQLNQGTLPVSSIAEGVALIVAGAFLLTPGFVTDAFGFLLLVPPVRQRIGVRLVRHMTAYTSRAAGYGPAGPDPAGYDPGAPAVDADYEDLGDREPDPDSPWKGR